MKMNHLLIKKVKQNRVKVLLEKMASLNILIRRLIGLMSAKGFIVHRTRRQD